MDDYSVLYVRHQLLVIHVHLSMNKILHIIVTFYSSESLIQRQLCVRGRERERKMERETDGRKEGRLFVNKPLNKYGQFLHVVFRLDVCALAHLHTGKIKMQLFLITEG